MRTYFVASKGARFSPKSVRRPCDGIVEYFICGTRNGSLCTCFVCTYHF